MKEPTGEEHITPVKITSISATERGGFRGCRRQWFLVGVHRLDEQSGNVHSFLGTLFHAGLEAYYGALMEGWTIERAEESASIAYQDEFDKAMSRMHEQLAFAWQFAKEEYRKYGELGFEMLQNYMAEERANPLLDEILAVELRVSIPIHRHHGRAIGYLSVKTDVVGMKDGRLRVVDHKTATRDMPSALVDLDDQHTAEAWSWWKHSGNFPDEVVRNVAKKVLIETPRLIRNGKALSQDKSQGTTLEFYEAAIQEHGFNRLDYADFLQFLRQQDANGGKFFTREISFRTPQQMAAFERDLYWEFHDAKEVALHPERAYPNFGEHCLRCPVKAICQTIQDDGDVAAIIKGGYVIADPRR